ncbi:hypothetical protein P879_08004 [Paragonimus westermani]|uniref:Leucine-rich repeat-containing protein 27 n=1 Tax=Paragonimus westermani TaxID=34504 RepID=A0A8T0DM50_9TREM|nr:hypothetical protein P879_08004 [Paragonimus westermani]
MKSDTADDSSVKDDHWSLSPAMERIKFAEERKVTHVDLSQLNLSECPQGLLSLTSLKKLNISRNSLRDIPAELFNQLYQLKWLDLRSNFLHRIPSAIKVLKNLQVLLIDDNRIQTLPFELGLLHKLKSLHSRNNPIEFPCKAILEKGAKTVVHFLHDCYISREQAAESRGEQNGTKLKPNNTNNMEGKMVKTCCENELYKAVCQSEDLQVFKSFDKPASSVCAAANGMTFNQEQNSPGQYDGPFEQPTESLRSFAEWDSVSRTDNEVATKPTNSINMGRLTESMWLGKLQETKDEKPSFSRSQIYKEVEMAHLSKREKFAKPQSAFEIYSTQTARHEALLPIDPPQPTLEKIRYLHAKERRKKSRQNALLKQHNLIQKLK